MFVVAGATGNTGSVVASTLLAQGKPVTVLVRDARKAAGWREKGAQVAVASVEDPQALAVALAPAEGAYLLIPPNFQAADALEYGFRVGDALAEAVKSSGISHVVRFRRSAPNTLRVPGRSARSTMPSRHRAGCRNLTILRPGYFLQNWAAPWKEFAIRACCTIF